MQITEPLTKIRFIISYKVFVRPYVDYGDIKYEEACSTSFH